MTDITDLPDILGLEWKPTTKPGPGVFYADWSHKFHDAKSVLGLPAGIADNENIEDRSGGSFYSTNAVTCRPAEINLDELNAWIAAAPAAIEQVKRATRKRHHDYPGPAHAAAVREAIAEAKTLLETWGLFTQGKPQILQLIDDEYLFPGELKTLRRLIKTTIVKAEAKALEVAGNAALDPVPDLTDDVIVKAIRALTALDADHAELANGKGWSKRTSSPGHWCASMLKIDRALAIKEGRRLIADHLPQLARLGVIDWDAVSQGRAA